MSSILVMTVRFEGRADAKVHALHGELVETPLGLGAIAWCGRSSLKPRVGVRQGPITCAACLRALHAAVSP